MENTAAPVSCVIGAGRQVDGREELHEHEHEHRHGTTDSGRRMGWDELR